MGPGNWAYNAKSCSCLNLRGKWRHDRSLIPIKTKPCRPLILPRYQILTGSVCLANEIMQKAKPLKMPIDCCDDCRVNADRVRLNFWPVKQFNQTVSQGSDPDSSQYSTPSGFISHGITFVSPSVYVAFTSLFAFASCVRTEHHGGPEHSLTIGKVYQHTIQSYKAEQLSSANCFPDSPRGEVSYCLPYDDPRASKTRCFKGLNTGWDPINFEELANPPPDSIIYDKKKTCFPSDVGFEFETGDAKCLFSNPQFSLPPDVTDIDPTWRSWGHGACIPYQLGVRDPPRILPWATALVDSSFPLSSTPHPLQSFPSPKQSAAHGLVSVSAKPGQRPSSPLTPTAAAFQTRHSVRPTSVPAATTSITQDLPVQQTDPIDVHSMLSDDRIIQLIGNDPEWGPQRPTSDAMSIFPGRTVHQPQPTLQYVKESQIHQPFSLPDQQLVLPADGKLIIAPKVTMNPTSQVAIEGFILSPGGTPATISGHIYSLIVHQSSPYIIVKSGGHAKTYPLPPMSDAPVKRPSGDELSGPFTVSNSRSFAFQDKHTAEPKLKLPNGKWISVDGPAISLKDGTKWSILPGLEGVLLNGTVTLLGSDPDLTRMTTAATTTKISGYGSNEGVNRIVVSGTKSPFLNVTRFSTLTSEVDGNGQDPHASIMASSTAQTDKNAGAVVHPDYNVALPVSIFVFLMML